MHHMHAICLLLLPLSALSIEWQTLSSGLNVYNGGYDNNIYMGSCTGPSAWYIVGGSSDYFKNTLFELTGGAGMNLVATIPEPRSYIRSSCAVIGDQVYFHSSDTSAKLFSCDTTLGLCVTRTTSGPIQRKESGFVAVGNVLYLFGGDELDFTTLGDTWKIDTASGAWTWVQLTPTTSPPQRKGHGAAAIGTTIYIYGGYDDTGSQATVDGLWSFDTTAATPTWTNIPASATPGDVTSGFLLALNSRLYTGFGYDAGMGTNELWQYTPGSGWNEVTTTNPPSQRAYPAVGTIGNTLYLLGGGQADLYSIDLTTAGSVSGDPHFRSFAGGEFDITGEPGRVYNLLTASWGQVNGLFVGRPNGPTFIGKLGFVLKLPGGPAVSLTYDATTGDLSVAQDSHLTAIYENVELGRCSATTYIAQTHGKISSISIPGLRLSMSRKWQPKLLGFGCTLKTTLNTTDPCFVRDMHGLLGQTINWKPLPSVAHLDGEQLIAGRLSAYVEPSLLSTKSNFSRYVS